MEDNKPMTLRQLIDVCEDNGVNPDLPIICTADCDMNPFLVIEAVGLAMSPDGSHDATLIKLKCIGKLKAVEIRLPNKENGIDWNALLKDSYGKGGPKS